MRLLIQRVNHASVKVDGEVIGNIGKGFLVLVGIGQNDTREIADKYMEKNARTSKFLKMKMAKQTFPWQM